MDDEDLKALADTVLTPGAEHEWALLRELVDFADRLVVAFVFADRFPVRVLRARLQKEALESGMPFRLVVCDEPEALRNDALAAVLAPETDHEITWFEAFGTVDDLREAWNFAAQRWNEHREPLRRSSLRALIVAAPVWAKQVIRLAAPDLWSITNLVIEPAGLPAAIPSTGFHRSVSHAAGGTPSEQAVAESWIGELLNLPREAPERQRDLIEALGDAVRAGAWPAAIRAVQSLDLSPQAIQHQVIQAKRGGEEDVFELAARLNNLSIHLSSLGRLAEAFSLSQVATSLFRDLAIANPTLKPELAQSLNNLAFRLKELGRQTEAVAIMGEAIQITRILSQQSQKNLPGLAVRLGNFSGWLYELGQLQQALPAARESTETFRLLTGKGEASFLRDLAAMLSNQSLILSKMGRFQEALALAQEAVDISRQGVASDPEVLHNLANSLNNLGYVLGHLGRYEEGLAAAEESVTITIGLARSSPAAFSSLRTSVETLEELLKRTRREPGSSAALREAEALLGSVGEATSSEEP